MIGTRASKFDGINYLSSSNLFTVWSWCVFLHELGELMYLWIITCVTILIALTECSSGCVCVCVCVQEREREERRY